MSEVEGIAAGLDGRPADPRHTAFPKTDRAARHDPEALDTSVLLRLVECELEPETDAERRASRTDAIAQRVVESAGAQPCHRARGRPDAG